jgi:uncharacterized protein YbjT (DUF2867 family)
MHVSAKAFCLYKQIKSLGSSVVNTLLADGIFTPRAITRDVASDSAKLLKEKGAEVVQGEFGDIASLKAAIKGSEAVFAVCPSFNNYFGH